MYLVDTCALSDYRRRVSSVRAWLDATDDGLLFVSALTVGEIVTAVILPTLTPGTGAAFARLTRRRGVDLAILSVCCLVDPEGEVRFGLGAVGPRPFLVRDSAAAGVGSAAVERFAALVARASPITDVRASRDYRQAMITVLARRTLAAAIERSGWVSP